MPNASGGYQPDTKSPSARRADFDLLRRNTTLQKRIEELQAEIDATEARITALETPVSWIPVTAFLNGWVSYDAARPAMYRKVRDVVSLRGVIKNGTMAAATGAFLMPPGYRPAYLNESFAVNSGNLFGSIDVSQTGYVVPQTGTNAYVFLSGVSYSVTL